METQTTLLKELADFDSSNPELVEVYGLSETAIFKEIVLFLDKYEPEWRKTKQLGWNAPTLFLEVMEEFYQIYRVDFERDFVADDAKTKRAYKKALKNLHETIEDKYYGLTTVFDVSTHEVNEAFDELVDEGLASRDDEDYREKWTALFNKITFERGEEIYMSF
jgi:hypothetical protein